MKSAKYKVWQKEAMQEIMLQRTGQPSVTAPVQLTITVPYSGGRGDVCNREKVVTDTLVKMGVLPDDNDKVIPRVIMQTGAPPGRCHVLIESITGVSIPHMGKVS